MSRTPEGDAHGYVGQLIDPDWSPEQAPAKPIDPPRHPDQLPFPEPGIYFGMPEEQYHAIHALSSSGVKAFSVSSMNYWANSLLNLDREERQNRFLDYGKAVHAFVLEGEGAYLSRYVVALDPSDFEGCLVSTAEIKAVIGQHTTVAPVRPVGTTRQELIDQLADLGQKHGVAVVREGTVPQLKERIAQFEEEVPVKPVTQVEDVMEDGTPYKRRAEKADLIDQLLVLDPSARVWDKIASDHLAEHEGKEVISIKDDRRIRVAAHMILKHPEIGPMMSKGFAEVSLFWYCPRTGAPMKARLDWFKLHALIDLKSFSNQQGMPVDRAIEKAIANYGYNVQHVIYDEAVQAVRALIRTAMENGEALDALVHHSGPPEALPELMAFCENWANAAGPPEFIFLFQQSGIAPVTRGKRMPRELVFTVTKSRVDMIKRQWLVAAKTYGTDPWLDNAPIEDIDDEMIPSYATEIGRSNDE